jgi:hypothetical protein
MKRFLLWLSDYMGFILFGLLLAALYAFLVYA